MLPHKTIEQRLQHAVRAVLPDADVSTVLVRPSSDAKFGDYQANCAMPLGKRLGKPPREIAGQILAALDVAEFCETPQIALWPRRRVNDRHSPHTLIGRFARSRLCIRLTPTLSVLFYIDRRLSDPQRVRYPVR